MYTNNKQPPKKGGQYHVFALYPDEELYGEEGIDDEEDSDGASSGWPNLDDISTYVYTTYVIKAVRQPSPRQPDRSITPFPPQTTHQTHAGGDGHEGTGWGWNGALSPDDRARFYDNLEEGAWLVCV